MRIISAFLKRCKRQDCAGRAAVTDRLQGCGWWASLQSNWPIQAKWRRFIKERKLETVQ